MPPDSGQKLHRLRRLRVLDAFTCQGGNAHGWALAGWDVTGVDIVPQPRNPYPVIVADAVEYIREHGHEYDAIHASPPCQRYSATQRIQRNDHPDLIGPTREALETTGLPYVIENVVDARGELHDPVMLCGAMFPQLRVYRHRLFETNWPLTVPLHPEHVAPQVKMGRWPRPGEFIQCVGNFSNVAYGREAMGMPWASREGLREAIPPAYGRYVAERLLEHLAADLRAAA